MDKLISTTHEHEREEKDASPKIDWLSLQRKEESDEGTERTVMPFPYRIQEVGDKRTSAGNHQKNHEGVKIEHQVASVP